MAKMISRDNKYVWCDECAAIVITMQEIKDELCNKCLARRGWKSLGLSSKNFLRECREKIKWLRKETH